MKKMIKIILILFLTMVINFGFVCIFDKNVMENDIRILWVPYLWCTLCPILCIRLKNIKEKQYYITLFC